MALLVCIAGGTMTLGADQLWLQQWAFSGTHRIPAAGRKRVDLPAGQTLVYYESRAGIAADRIHLYVRDSDGAWVRPKAAPELNDFRMMVGGWSGQSLWNIDLQEPGTFDIWCVNGDYATATDIPSDDCLVIDKQPSTLSDAGSRRKMIQITGTTLTVGLAILLYGVHFAVLRGRAVEKEVV